jgi:looped-hinge helix DNA binding domain, AbrB family
MKATGIIRRIDELGRIVIPKEIRKNLKIREGESLEIYINSDETIILKKFSVLKNLKDFSKLLVESIYGDIKKNIIITDTDKVIAVSGKDKKDLMDKELSENIVFSINRREKMLEKHTKKLKITEDYEIESTYTISTIISNGDAVGSVIIYDSEEKIGEIEEKIANVVASFLAKHIEE